jgi:hypothetical protein
LGTMGGWLAGAVVVEPAVLPIVPVVDEPVSVPVPLAEQLRW